jgi:hypothetical protein
VPLLGGILLFLLGSVVVMVRPRLTPRR